MSSPRKPPDDDATWPTVDPAVTVPEPMRPFEPHEILPLAPGNLDEEEAEAEWQALIAAAREDDDEGPAYPFLPGETPENRANRILAGRKRGNRWGTPMEGPVTDGHAAAVYSAPAHAVPAATRTEHPKARVLFDHTERLPILAAAQALAPATPSAIDPVPQPSLDPARLAPTLRLPRAAAGPRPDVPPSPDATRFRRTAVLTLVMAVGTAIAIGALATLSRPVSSASPASPEPAVLPMAPSPRPSSLATAPSTLPLDSTVPSAPSSARLSVPGAVLAPAAVPPTALPLRTPERLAPAVKPQPAPQRSKPPIQHETAP